MDVTWLGGDVLGENAFWISVGVYADRGVIPSWCPSRCVRITSRSLLVTRAENPPKWKWVPFPTTIERVDRDKWSHLRYGNDVEVTTPCHNSGNHPFF